MSIAEKLTTIAENEPKVYQAGYETGRADADILRYVSSNGSVENLFYRADFGGKDEVKIEIPNCPPSLSQMFAFVVGLRKVTLSIPTTQTYNGYRLIYGGADMVTSIVELVLPGGIKFTDFTNFSRNAPALKTISGRIDLSECTVAPNPFQNCTSLENVEFVKKSIPLSISFANSPDLSGDSINSIIEGLADLTGQTAQTLTLNEAVTDKLSSAQMSAVALKNWNIA